jgi:hypothetical protein
MRILKKYRNAVLNLTPVSFKETLKEAKKLTLIEKKIILIYEEVNNRHLKQTIDDLKSSIYSDDDDALFDSLTLTS